MSFLVWRDRDVTGGRRGEAGAGTDRKGTWKRENKRERKRYRLDW